MIDAIRVREDLLPFNTGNFLTDSMNSFAVVQAVIFDLESCQFKRHVQSVHG